MSPYLCGIRVPVVRPTNWSECSVSYESWEKPCGQARLRCSLPPIARLGGCGYLSRPHPMGSLRRYGSFSLQQQDSPSVAIGSPAAGVKGFRRSHAQAVAIRSVVLARKRAEPTVVADSDPGLAAAALVGRSIEDVRTWVVEVLGRLAADTDSDARLRETFRVFLNAGASYTLAAEQLTLHFNTVKYRVGRALARRGRPITDDRFDVELALLLCHWYGDAMLLPQTP